MSSPRNCLRQCCCCCMDDTDSDNEDIGLCKIACCLEDDEDSINENKCLTVHHTCLGYIFPRLMNRVVDKMDRKPVLLIAGRRVPKSACYRIQVYVYLTIMAILTGLWFLVTLLEQVIYHSTTSCDEIGINDSRYHICFDLNANWSIVNCQHFLLGNHSTASILCYTYSITPSAFGIAFSVASFVSTIISVTFYSAIYCSDEGCSRRGLIIIQFLFMLALVCCAVSIGILYVTEERQSLVNYFLNERAPLRGVLLALFGVSLLLGSCLPWAPFKDKRTYEIVASDQP